MPPPPTLFDDDSEPSTVSTVSTVSTDDGPVPNYLFRRALVVGGVVAVIVVAAVLLGRLVSSDGDDGGNGAATAEWNRIVLVDDRTGRVIVLDESGEEVGRIESSVGSPTGAMVVESTALLASDDATAIVSLADESSESFELAADAVIAPSGTTLTMIAAASSGDRALLVHGPSGDSIDTAEFAPIAGARFDFSTARSAATGRDVLVTDTGNFQSVLFSFDRDEPSYFPGLAFAVDGDHVITAQNVGTNATVNAFDHTGEQLSSGTTPSVRAAMITGDTVRLVSVDGQVITMSLDSGDTEPGAMLDIGTVESGHVTPTGDRLVVIGTTGTALIDDGGDVITTYPGLAPFDDMALRGSTCMTLIDSSDTGDGQLMIVDLTDGSTVAEADIVPTLVVRSADGCTIAAADADGYDVVDADGVQRFDGDDLVALAPDATSSVAERDRRLVLIALADTSADEPADDEPADLGPVGRSVFFTQT